MRKKNRLNYLGFIIFILVYSVSTSIWQVPYSSTIRWIVMGFLIVYGVLLGRGKFFLFLKEYLCIVAAFVIGFVVSVQRPNFYIGIERFCSFFLLIIGMYAYFEGGISENHRVETGIKIYAYILETLVFILTIFYLFSGQSFGEYRAIYGNKNYAAPIFCTAFGYCVILYTTEKQRIVKLIHLIATLLSIFLVIATGSRAAFISLLLYVLILPFIVETRKSSVATFKRIVLFVLAFVIVYLTAKYANIPALARILGKVGTASSTGLSRGDIWKNGIYLFSLKPVFGWGSSAVYYYTFVNNVSGYSGWGVHSSYIMMLIDHGVVGIILFLLFAVLILKRYLDEFSFARTNLGLKEVRTVLSLAAVCGSLLIDATAEAFIFSTGNFASVCFWTSFIFIDLFLRSLCAEDDIV